MGKNNDIDINTEMHFKLTCIATMLSTTCINAEYKAFITPGIYPTHEQAFGECKKLNMTLATVKTDEDQKSLIEVAQKATDDYYTIGAVSYYHIGMTRDNHNSPWMWHFINTAEEHRSCSPSKFGKTFWADGYPSTDFDGGFFCGYAQIYDSRYPWNKNWYNTYCQNLEGTTGYICGPRVEEGSCGSNSGGGGGSPDSA